MGGGSRLRWQVVDDGTGQQALFAGAERHVGKGEFRGMEFLHVNARRIINSLPPAARLPFRHTVNVYRGCSHACSYCVAGDTPVLMADGRTKEIARLRAGDVVYGTAHDGRHRRYVATPVLDHWETCTSGVRVSLADGTTLVASADHRFLTERGWKHVTGAEDGPTCRPHLTLSDTLVGTGSSGPAPVDRQPVTRAAPLEVVEIEPLGSDVPMYDITTGTGDFIANGVVSHNCFARPTHEYLNLDSRRDFETKIVVKVNAVERLRAELDPRRWCGEPVAMGTNTDPYQRCEGKYRLTRGVIEALGEAANPFSILTKSTLIVRDLDVLVEAAARTSVGLSFSIGTLDDDVWRTTEPGTPHPRRRVEAIARLTEAGLPCSVLMGPVIPGLSDDPDQIDDVVRAALEAGATNVSPITLHLRPGVRELFLPWLEDAHPDLAARYRTTYRRSYAPTSVQQRIGALVARSLERHGGRRPSRPPPARPPAAPQPGAVPARDPVQLGLSL